MLAVSLLVGAYLVGSVPFGYLLVRSMKGVDVRRYGSHNVGAINVARVGGIWLGLATFAADGGKATAVVLAAHALPIPDVAVAAAALLVMVGHAYSLWFLLRDHRFSEGKSVACALGVLMGLAASGVISWVLALAPLGVWLLGLLLPRLLMRRWYCISPATMVASACIPAAIWAARPAGPYLVLGLGMAALILVRHKHNLARLRAGTEPRLGQVVTAPPGGA